MASLDYKCCLAWNGDDPYRGQISSESMRATQLRWSEGECAQRNTVSAGNLVSV